MKSGELLNKMLVLATNKHSGQYDRGGNPYILHVLKVMYFLKSNDEELQCIALGHDLIEDTNISYTELYQLGFTYRIVDGIKSMTKQLGQSYDDYKIQVMSNSDAIKVKLCDLRHNTDIRRLKGITEKDIVRMEKYHKFFVELMIADRGNDK